VAGDVTGDAAGTDREVLRGAAYADSSKLEDRRAIYRYREPRFDLVEAVLDLVAVPVGGRVLDLGCGPGVYLAASRAREPLRRQVGVDLSVGMLDEARHRLADAAHLLAADAVALPFDGASFDGVLANHMLYHVPEIGQAVAEVRRVLCEGGTFLAVTNSIRHFEEFDALLAQVAGRGGWWRPSHRFTLENGGEHLERCFDDVQTFHFEGELRVPDAEPVLRFARSMRDLSGEGYDDAGWHALMTRFESAVAEVIAAEGAFRTRTDTGVLVCR
jgi:SAM-dependent methyltransferase